MTDISCNGWRNAATWTVNLWFGDSWAMMADEGDEITAEYCRDSVEDYVRDVIGEDNGFIWDMLDLRSVDWDALAEHHAPIEEEA
jgi:hypothetical protein